MFIPKTYEVPEGYVRIHSAKPLNEALPLAEKLQAIGRVIVLVYKPGATYAVYAKV